MVKLSDIQPQKPTKSSDNKSINDFLNQDISFLTKKFGDKQKESFYAELGTLLDAGVDIRTGLDIIETEQRKKKDKLLIQKLKEDVVQGLSLSQALQKHKDFTEYEYYSIQIGEETGKLSLILKELSLFYKKKVKQRMQMVSAMTYPIIVLSFATVAVIFLLRFIVPMFRDIFSRFGSDLPALTEAVISASDFIGNNFYYLLLIILLIIIGTRLVRQKEWYRKYKTAIILRIPVFGATIKKIQLSRFSQAMSLLAASKVPLVRSIQLVKKMVTFYPIQSSLDQIEKDIVQGKPLYESLSQFKIYNKKLVSLIKVGEEVNQLDRFFEKINDQYQDEVEAQSKALSSLMEPILIIFLGIVVGIILVAMYLPLFSLSTQMN